MRKLSTMLFAAALMLPTCAGAKGPNTFLEAQQCRINGTVDLGCFQQKLPRFEQFVLQDEAGWMQKSIVAEALVKYYDQTHTSSPAATAVRAKAEVYSKANAVLDASERGEIDDCKDEPNPDGCLRSRYCFKEAYIKVKNVLVTNGPEKFQAELRWFDKEIKNNC
jgi:phosphopantetheinyl transferase (holo-ACP synthase)